VNGDKNRPDLAKVFYQAKSTKIALTSESRDRFEECVELTSSTEQKLVNPLQVYTMQMFILRPDAEL
jgi:hypothetical protein